MTSPWVRVPVLLVVLALAASLAEAGVTTGDGHGFLFQRSRTPWSVRTEIVIATLGFKLTEEMLADLKEGLNTAMPYVTPVSLESPDLRQVRYNINYILVDLDRDADASLLASLQTKLKSEMISDGRQRDYGSNAAYAPVPKYTVPVEKVELMYDQVYDEVRRLVKVQQLAETKDAIKGIQQTMPYRYTLLLVNPDKMAMRPDGMETMEYVYRYRFQNGGRTQAWVAANRYAVVDYASGVVQFGSSDVGSGTVASHSLVRWDVSSVPASIKVELEDRRRGEKNHDDIEPWQRLRANIITVTNSAMEHLFIPDVSSNSIYYAERILVPVIVLRNHNKFNPWEPGHPAYMNINTIANSVKDMMISGVQEATVIPGVHSIHEHKHIAMAISKSIRADTVHEMSVLSRYTVKTKPYLDGKTLLKQLTESSDLLTAGLIHQNDDLKSTFYSKGVPGVQDDEGWGDELVSQSSKTQGTRVLPVYVLSLLGMEKDMLIDHTDLVIANSDAVIVLQTGHESIQLPYFSDNAHVFVSSNNVERQIIAGIAQALGGLVPPSQHYSKEHGAVAVDYFWANGAHPFGHFSNTTRVSKIFRDMIIRNAILARMNAATLLVDDANAAMEQQMEKYLSDPFGAEIVHKPRDLNWLESLYHDPPDFLPLPRVAVDQFHTDLETLLRKYRIVANSLRELDLAQAYRDSNMVLVAANTFKHHILDQIDDIHQEMACCDVAHRLTEGPSSGMTRVVVILGMALAFLSVTYLVRPRKHRNVQ